MTSRTVTGDRWRAAVAEAAGEGWRFAGLYATHEAIRAAFTRGDERLLLRTGEGDRRLESIVDLVPAAAWDEREAHDLYGWAFAGHDRPRPLVDHDAAGAGWAARLEGRDAYRLAVGPIHAGIIESGHFRFVVVGERVLHLDLRLFYKHRGLQAAAEGRPYEESIAYAQRACAADAVANAVAYAHACESARGLRPDPELSRARTLLLELERLYNHLNDISAVCAGVGFAPGTMLFAAFKERAQRLNTVLSGHRFLFDSVRVGASVLTIDAASAAAARAELADLRGAFVRGWRELAFAGSFQERLEGIGVTTRATVQALGGVGPVARAAGVAMDARSASPRLAYGSFTAAVPDRADGDVAARLEVRGLELVQTFAILERLLERPLAPSTCFATGDGESDAGVATVESPRGQTLCVVELDGDRLARLHLRTGSYANWPLLALACRDELLPDFPLINKSFELCYACVDR